MENVQIWISWWQKTWKWNCRIRAKRNGFFSEVYLTICPHSKWDDKNGIFPLYWQQYKKEYGWPACFMFLSLLLEPRLLLQQTVISLRIRCFFRLFYCTVNVNQVATFSCDVIECQFVASKNALKFRRRLYYVINQITN